MTGAPSNPPQTVLLTGVSGAGKSTVGRALAAAIDADLVDADDLHPASNVEKMASGRALDDADREPWIDRLVDELRRREAAGERVVLACSALRRTHRRRLVGAVDDVAVVHLHVSADELRRRLSERTDHFMPAELLQSQLESLESPEAHHALVVDGDRPVAEVVDGIVSHWR
ncbi:MAG: gluconokinase [Acidimicrobiia bacterium]